MTSSLSFDASENPIKAVTVFSSNKAEVVRTFTLDLQKGQNELKIYNLPSCVDLDTARLTGLGDAVLFDVVCSLEVKAAKPTTSAKYRELQRKLSQLQGEKRVHEHEADILVNYGKTLHGEHRTNDYVQAFLAEFVDHGKKNLEAIAELDREITEVEQEMVEETVVMIKAIGKGPTNAMVTAIITAQREGKVEVTLTYMVGKAGWKPSYDLRATTENGKPAGTVSLHYRALITQGTGEDWKDTTLTLSTAAPEWSFHLPTLAPIRIRPGLRHGGGKAAWNTANNTNRAAAFGVPQQQSLFGQAPQQQAFMQQPAFQQQVQQPAQSTSLFGAAPRPQATGFGGFGSSAPAASSGGLFGVTNAYPPVPAAAGWNDGATEPPTVGAAAAVEPAAEPEQEETPGPLSESGTVVTEGAVASSYRIEGVCSIPSDDETHKVAIAILPFEAKVHYVAAPRIRPVVFLQCEVTNSSEYRLLPGPVSVYLDNSPVSKTSIVDVNPEETFHCTLGPDPSLRISYTRYPRTNETSKLAFAAHTTTSTFKATAIIQNKHTFPIKNFILREVIPLSDQDNIQVVLKLPKGLAEAKEKEIVDQKSSKGNLRARWTRTIGGKSGDKEGKYEWLADIGAGDEVKMEVEWEVRAPADFIWGFEFN
ncbi:hypothetical protein BD410DRAFT_784883 [Rickenella mellea]|uniref:DUF4139 domain-containing protein n=1 Tax=Rickenella mellea TaxID=50990 RepID=A0A4Y7QG68_9AGAM|nr:hypothetical protein BD410DRAFT_784883 [Rickenella mellea]